MAPLLISILLLAATLSPHTAIASEEIAGVEVQRGRASFEVATNVPVIRVSGESNDMRGRARLQRTGDRLALEEVEAIIPVMTLKTGLGVRDEHMRQRIFTTADGALPDVRFIARGAECAPSSGSQMVCRMSGELTIRGCSRPFTMALHVRPQGSGFRASGEGVVRLSAYGIAPPSQLGVTTEDEVKLRLELTTRPAPTALARSEGR